MSFPLNRRAFLQSVIVGTLAAPFVPRQQTCVDEWEWLEDEQAWVRRSYRSWRAQQQSIANQMARQSDAPLQCINRVIDGRPEFWTGASWSRDASRVRAYRPSELTEMRETIAQLKSRT